MVPSYLQYSEKKSGLCVGAGPANYGQKVVHGLSVPLGQLGYHLPRTLSSAIASRSLSENPDEPRPPFRVGEQLQHRAQLIRQSHRSRNSQLTREEPPRPVFRIGGSVIQSATSENGIGLQNVDAAQERSL